MSALTRNCRHSDPENVGTHGQCAGTSLAQRASRCRSRHRARAEVRIASVDVAPVEQVTGDLATHSGAAVSFIDNILSIVLYSDRHAHSEALACSYGGRRLA